MEHIIIDDPLQSQDMEVVMAHLSKLYTNTFGKAHARKMGYIVDGKQLKDMVDEGDWQRAGGECTCTDCGKPYSQHKQGNAPNEWITILCDGSLVKL